MRILWLDINSSYSHSSVALPAIHAQVQGHKEWEWVVVRGTINDDPGTLASAVAEFNPDIIAATFWLFTHQMQLEVLYRAVQLVDNPTVICGGPEFLGNNEDFLRKHGFVSAVLRGEGEEALPEFIESLVSNDLNTDSDWANIDGLCWISKSDGSYHDNGVASVLDFAGLKYPESSSFFNWDKPFVQLETTRGCFNTCKFCVSGGEKPVREQSISQIEERLENICAHGIKDVRVLDRTFNYDTARACQMLDLFCRYAGRMRFHLEIHPALMPVGLKAKLEDLPKGLLHVESGIQSLSSKVLEACDRKGNLKASLDGLMYLCSLDNIETHADLIAGLPYYDLMMLQDDVRALVSMSVDELQLESLKVLPGTRMRDEAVTLGLKYSPLPPYEVLSTESMSTHELKTAMQISRMLDFYYNCAPWQAITRKLVTTYDDFLIRFTTYLKDQMVLDAPLSLERRGVILYEYCTGHYPEMLTEISVAWIMAGCSTKKTPAGNVVKIKNLEGYMSEADKTMSICFGTAEPSHRYFLLTGDSRSVLFGYDSENHKPSPVFMAELD